MLHYQLQLRPLQFQAWALWALLLPSLTFAQSLTLEEAVSRALAGSPAVRADSLLLDAAGKRVALEALPPPPTIGSELENVAGNGDLKGFDSAEGTLRIGRVFELGSKRQLRQDAGEAALALRRNDGDGQRLTVISEATRRYVDVIARQEALALRDASLRLARDNQDAIQYRVTRGRAGEGDATLATLAIARAELAREDAEHELDSARVSLSSLWGDTTGGFGNASGRLEPLPAIPPFEILTARLNEAPGLRSFALEEQSLKAQASLAEAQGMPDITTSLGVRHLEAADDQGLVFSVAVPLGVRSRSKLALEENRLMRGALDARRDAARNEAYQMLYGEYRELEHAAHEVEALRDRMIPRAEQALQLLQEGYDEARYSVLDVAQARALLLDLQTERIEAAARFHQLLARIQRATAINGVPQP